MKNDNESAEGCQQGIPFREEWIPGIRLGSLTFGSSLEEIMKVYKVQKITPYRGDLPGCTTYQFPGSNSLELSVEAGMLTGIYCWQKCFLEGVDLIGMTVEKAVNYLGRHFAHDPEWDAPGDGIISYSCTLGGSLFFSEGKVSGVSIHEIIDPEDPGV
jgi:hypothetical protein